MFETGAIVFHIAQRHAGLLPDVANARARAITWMFAALSTVEPPILELGTAKLLEGDKSGPHNACLSVEDRVRNRLGQLSRHLGDAELSRWSVQRGRPDDGVGAAQVESVGYVANIRTSPPMWPAAKRGPLTSVPSRRNQPTFPAVDLIERSQQSRSLKVRHLRCGRVMVQLARLPLREGCVMNSLRGRRDPRTGRVFGFQSETQRENFMVGRARFCNGPNREMPRCTALNRLGEPCKAARMRGRSTCFRHSGSAVKRARLAAAHLSGDLDRIQRAEMRSERNRLRVLWRRDPREPGRTIVLVTADEATCRAWASRQGFQLDVLDRDFPAFADAVPMDMGADVAWSDQ